MGKTKLGNAICESIGLPFGFIQLGGVSDGHHLVGHSYTYEGSRCGIVADTLTRAKCMNPVLYFDELDKISKTHNGEEIANMLIHITDATQNSRFRDKYYGGEVELDLSRCLMIFSYNDASAINPILGDRMIKIKATGYSLAEKCELAQNHLIPELLAEYRITGLAVSDEAVRAVVDRVPAEAGVRNMRRALDEILSRINLETLMNGKEIRSVGVEDVHRLLVTNKTQQDANPSHLFMYV